MKHLSALSFIAFSMLIACSESKTSSERETPMIQEKEINTIQQVPEDLLTGVHGAICYSGFRSGQHPDRGDGAVNPSPAEILEDLQVLSSLGFKLIRMYDCGENSQDVLRVIKENQLDIKVLQGVWLKAELSAHETCAWLTEPIPQETLDYNKGRNEEELERGIMLANMYPDIIAAVNIGNEALVEWNDHKVDVDTIISYVQRVQTAIQQPVTVADNYEWWANSGAELAKVVDFLSLHIYPVWEGKDIDEGMSYSIANVQRVKDSIPDAKIVITEAGWASVASEFGERASEEKQLEYYRDLMQWSADMNITTFFFEAFDEDWKGNPDNMMGAEKHWGIFTVDRKPKKVVNELLLSSGME